MNLIKELEKHLEDKNLSEGNRTRVEHAMWEIVMLGNVVKPVVTKHKEKHTYRFYMNLPVETAKDYLERVNMHAPVDLVRFDVVIRKNGQEPEAFMEINTAFAKNVDVPLYPIEKMAYSTMVCDWFESEAAKILYGEPAKKNFSDKDEH